MVHGARYMYRLIGFGLAKMSRMPAFAIHAPSMRHISLVFNLARQARKKQMLLQDGKMARWQAAFCNFLPPSGGRIKPTPPTSVEKESA